MLHQHLVHSADYTLPTCMCAGASQLFDALVMVANTNGDGAGVGGPRGWGPEGGEMVPGVPLLGGGQPPVHSAMHLTALVGAGGGAAEGRTEAGEAAGAGGAGGAVKAGSRVHAPPARDKSRLWSAMSYGEIDSLQVQLGGREY